MKRAPLPGQLEAIWELEGAILRTTIETRVLLRHLQELRKQVRTATRCGRLSICLEGYLVEYLNQGMAGSLQKVTRQVNTSRRAVLDFLGLNNNPKVPEEGT